jgi:exopolysaccharide biosynthesis polyprenyl glycosylphosphotransferase
MTAPSPRTPPKPGPAPGKPRRGRSAAEAQLELAELGRRVHPSRGSRARATSRAHADVEVPVRSAEGQVDFFDREDLARAVEQEPFPIVAQRRAVAALRSHFARDLIRKATLVAGDLAVVLLMQVTFRAVRESGLLGTAIGQFSRTLLPPGTLLSYQLVIALACGFLVAGVYVTRPKGRGEQRLVLGTAVAFGLIFWQQAWRHLDAVRSVALLAAFCFVSGALLLERRLLARWLISAKPGRGRTLIVGTAEDARALCERDAAENRGVDLVGYVPLNGYGDPSPLGLVQDLTAIIADHEIDTVIMCGERAAEPSATHLVWIAEDAGCRVLLMPSPVLAHFQPEISWQCGIPLVQLTRPGLRGGQLALKRAGDIVVSLCLIVTLAPLLMVLAAVVRLTSPGPIIFRQIRVGAGGRQFAMYKFRSMVDDAEAKRVDLMDQSVYADGRLFKVLEDPRVTEFGAFMRRTSLDELPQLWNVLRGDMSLVGPRPPLPSEVALYEEHHYARFHMKPGMTGPWQVGGRNRVVEFQDVVRIETEYMRNWSISKDFAILVRTVPAVVHSTGAV